MASITIRRATEADEAALSRICLLTADAGKSAEHLHDFGELPGLVYAVPYVKLPTTWGFVLVDDTHTVVGYILGSKDTRAYEQYAAEHWWPVLAEKYPPESATKPADVRYMHLLRAMHTAPAANITFASAHLHIDILPEYQKQGWGRKLMQTALDYLKGENIEGSGVWLGLDPRNEGARKFYERLGFAAIEGAPEGNMGIKFQ
ncbi:acyl-CoA N-acyltransferase [Desarmillaria tabescens]|uniref:Acyl-CoA N-acyltransferase n=1 Tax=Armillaria tabescens TaxID=1929756 RepID=A0AA39NMC3_ARMTA|nr:acyl-CoA N-acyltransferase [Desarmillaria tabescens]KAK0468215.1 acyl-CoA N-acyltransferase [Desarmillaria tabescens]